MDKLENKTKNIKKHYKYNEDLPSDTFDRLVPYNIGGTTKSAIDTKVNTPPQAHNPVKDGVYLQRASDKSDEIMIFPKKSIPMKQIIP